MVAQADRTGNYDGCVISWWNGEIWTEEWLEDEPPAAAKAVVYHKQRKYPEVAIAKWSAYAQPNSSFWTRMPAHMLGKCAKALALRGAFPDQMAGLYAHEELQGSLDSDTGGEPMSSEERKIAEAQRKEDEFRARPPTEVKIVASSGGNKPSPAEAAEPAFEEDKEELPKPKSKLVEDVKRQIATGQPPKDPEPDELDMTPPDMDPPGQDLWWKTYKIQGIKTFLGRVVGELAPHEMALIEAKWIPNAHAQLARATQEQLDDLKALEERLAHDKAAKPW
jgi:RecT family protein